MAQSVKGPAPDRYPRRSAQARRTRVRVLDAARELFIERGYVATTIIAIADRADVSPETVYARFGSKRELLAQLVDLAIAGDVDAPPLLEQDWVREMRDEPDPHRRVRILARHGRAILERRAAVDEVVRSAAAADPEIGTLWELGREQRFAGQAELLRIVLGATGLRDGLGIRMAARCGKRCGCAERLVVNGIAIRQRWDARGQCAGLVEHGRIGLGKPFEPVRRLE